MCWELGAGKLSKSYITLKSAYVVTMVQGTIEKIRIVDQREKTRKRVYESLRQRDREIKKE